MKKIMETSFFLLLVGLISLYTKSVVSREVSERVSIYNIGNGTLIYTFSSGPNTRVFADYAYNLRGSWANNSNWDIIYINDGTMLFKNVYTGLCLQHYWKGYQVIQNNCDKNNQKQHIKPVLSSTGAIKLKFSNYNYCLYTYAGDSYFYIYSDTCRNTTAYLWSIIPQLRGASD